MEASELRIGNLITWQVEINKIEAIFTHDENAPTVMCDPMEAERPLSEFEPIKLSEEWLVRFGFITAVTGRKHFLFEFANVFSCHWDGKRITIEQYSEGECELEHIEYVHQFQNFYFALTGKDLTFSLTLPMSYFAPKDTFIQAQNISDWKTNPFEKGTQ